MLEKTLDKHTSQTAGAALDPRLYQIAALAGLLVYGVGWAGLDVRPAHVPLLLGTALVTQYVCSRLARLPAFDPRSALISGLSLCLLLRTNHAWLAVLAAVVTIASKFTLRAHGKHLFNPTNFGLVVLLTAGAPIWVSPGQWGNSAWFGFAMACAGSLVVTRAARADTSLAFLFAYGGVIFGRALWLGQPVANPLHRLENGALLLFAFFMISDPKTTPDSRPGRILFAVLVALGAGFVHFVLYRTNGLLWSLGCCSVVVPVIDRLLPDRRYEWTQPAKQSLSPPPTVQPLPVISEATA
jgi:Na+-transporting NADH:ubiquinone oxidoreductase subunit NqrB